MSKAALRIVKVGGSLLTWSELPARLESWLAQQDGTTILIAGGGPWADLLRQSAKLFDLEESSAHHMCVKAMSVTAALLSDLVGVPCLSSFEARGNAIRPTEHRAYVFDTQDWLDKLTDLPKTWDVTSDSIAGRLAVAMDADELVLLKSCEATMDEVQALADDGYVDAFFPQVANSLKLVRYVNLRRAGEN